MRGSTTGSFPAISSVLSPQALADEVLPGFGLGALAEEKEIEIGGVTLPEVAYRWGDICSLMSYQ